MLSIGAEVFAKADIKPCRAIDLDRDENGIIWIKFVEGRVQFDVEVYKIIDLAEDTDGILYVKLDKNYKGWQLMTKAEFMREFEKLSSKPTTNLEKQSK